MVVWSCRFFGGCCNDFLWGGVFWGLVWSVGGACLGILVLGGSASVLSSAVRCAGAELGLREIAWLVGCRRPDIF